MTDAFALSSLDAAAGFSGGVPSLPPGDTRGNTFSNNSVVRFNASGTDNNSSEQDLRNDTTDTSMASRHDKS